MKKIFILLALLVLVFTLSSKQLQYNTAFENLDDGDTIDVDLHLHSPLDSIKDIINGNLGGDNISDTSSLRQHLVDSTYYVSSDWIYNYTRKWQHWTSGVWTGRFHRGAYLYINDSTANDQDFRIYDDSTNLLFSVNDDSTRCKNLIADTPYY